MVDGGIGVFQAIPNSLWALILLLLFGVLLPWLPNFFAPWGPQMELISYPKGMAYEMDAKSLLWMMTGPTK